VCNGENDDLRALNDVPNGKRETREQEPANTYGFSDARPERPGHRSLADGIQSMVHLIGETGPKPGQLKLVPVTRRGEVGGSSRMEADPHVLPATPALGEPCLYCLPVLGCDQARSNFASTFLELFDPNSSSV